MFKGHPAIIEECDKSPCEAADAYHKIHPQHKKSTGSDIKDQDSRHYELGSAFRYIQRAFAGLGMTEPDDGQAIERTGKNKAERNHRPSVYGHFTPKSYYDKEITDTGDDGKIAAVGILKDFQFAFSG